MGLEVLHDTVTNLTPGEIIEGSTIEIEVNRTGEIIYSNTD